MSDQTLQLISIGVYLVMMLYIGYYAYRRTSNLTDYMLGGRSLGPAVTALSAGAADMSGWLLMGLPGSIYLNGISASWIAIGLTIGAYLNWLYVAPRLRTYSQVAKNSITIPVFLENRFKDTTKSLRIVSSLIILIFFTIYVSSGMVSGAVFFESSFGTSYTTGLLIVSGVVITYTLFGGFLAVSWTDFVQGMMMLFALILVPLLAVRYTGGWNNTFTTIESINPDYFNFFTGTTVLGIISLAAWGLGYFGQPHIIIRFMAIKNIKEMKNARRIGISWMIFSLIGTMFAGFIGIAFFYENPQYSITNSETVFLMLGQILFHPLFAGFLLAAVLAAIMSTISSQLIVTSSALTEDLYKLIFKKNATDKHYVFFGRMAVLGVAIIAALLALNPDGSILDLVSYAWAGFGAAFGPVIILALYWRKMTNFGALAGMIGGAITVILWKNINLGEVLNGVYEIIPGFLINMLLIYIVSKLTYQPNTEIDQEFDESAKLVKAAK